MGTLLDSTEVSSEVPDDCTGISVSVWHKFPYGDSVFMVKFPTVLLIFTQGCFILWMNVIQPNILIDHWFPIHPAAEAASQTVSGDVRIQLFLRDNSSLNTSDYGDPSVSESAKLEQIEVRRQKELERQRMGKAGEIRLRLLYNPPSMGFEGSLTVTAVTARDLLGKNANGLSDPFVIFNVNGSEKQTSVKRFSN